MTLECRKCNSQGHESAVCPAYGSYENEMKFVKSCPKCHVKMCDDKARPMKVCWNCNKGEELCR